MSLWLIQSCKFGDSSSSAATVDITVTSTKAGSLLVAGGVRGSTTTNATVSSVAFSDGTGAFTQVPGAAVADATNHNNADLWYLPKSIGGKTTVRITWSVSNTDPKQGFVWEIGGFELPVVDVAGNVATTGSGTDDNGPIITPNVAPVFIAACVITAGVNIAANPKVGNVFTPGLPSAAATDANGNAGCGLIAGTLGSYQPVWTDGTSGAAFIACAAAFRESRRIIYNAPRRTFRGRSL